MKTKFYFKIPFILDPGKKVPKKMEKKIIKPLPGIIFSQNGRSWAEKEKSKFYSRIPFILDPGKKIPKKTVKKFKKL